MTLSKSLIILVFILVLIPSFSEKLPKNSLYTEYENNDVLQKIPDKIFAAEIHYSRIPYQYWEHRLQMVKAMGFNALSIYIMWNFHQIQKGIFDYEKDDKNLIGFLNLAKKYKFMILFRPGPYVCAQWDFGGMPARLLSIKDLVIRANNQIFLNEVKIYFSSLKDIINQFSSKNDGPIIMLQIQNQYGWYGKDKSYIQAIRKIWDDLEIDLPQYYVDWFGNIQICHWQGANIGLNDGTKEEQWVKTRQMQPNGYILGGQIYSGWLTHWGENWQGKNISDYTNQYKFLMTNNHSFSMYMAHGGSNFGLWAGANAFQNKSYDYGAHVTSYDYDAPINEQGSPNEKYHIFRNLSKHFADWQIPEIPSNIQMIKIKPFIVSGFADLLQNLPKPLITQTSELLSFQDERVKMWNQGFILYQTNLAKGNYEINLVIHDFALVYLNGEFIVSLDRSESKSHKIKILAPHYNSQLRILVESMGHINFGIQMGSDYKGLISFNAIFSNNKHNLHKQKLTADKFLWNLYAIPINADMLNWKNISHKQQFPRLFRHNITLDQIGDTYLNMQKWKKGYLFVNGYNLGRYWNKGPQHKIFLPGVWLKKGINQIVVLELLQGNAKFIQGDLTLNSNLSIKQKKDKKNFIQMFIEDIQRK